MLDDEDGGLFALEEIDGYEEVQKEAVLNKVIGSLSQWFGRASLSKKQAERAREAIRACLDKGVPKEDIVYCFKTASLLKGRKVVSVEDLEAALNKMSEDKTAGHTAHEIFQAWYDKWYKDNYTQNQGVIMKVLKDALLRGIPSDDVRGGMEIIGRSKQVVSEASLQYSMVVARAQEKKKEDAGMYGDMSSEEEILEENRRMTETDNTSTADTKQKANGFFDTFGW